MVACVSNQHLNTQLTHNPKKHTHKQAFGALDVAAHEELAFQEEVALLPCFALYWWAWAFIDTQQILLWVEILTTDKES